MKWVLLLLCVTVISVSCKRNVKEECQQVPTECIPHGEPNWECICEYWCHVGCGGSACDCGGYARPNKPLMGSYESRQSDQKTVRQVIREKYEEEFRKRYLKREEL